MDGARRDEGLARLVCRAPSPDHQQGVLRLRQLAVKTSVDLSLHGARGDDLGDTTYRCVISEEMARHLRSSRGMGGNHAGHLHAFDLLVVVYVSTGRLHETACEAASLARTKLQAPCMVVCLTDL